MNVYITGIASSVSWESNGDVVVVYWSLLCCTMRLFWGFAGPRFSRILAIVIRDPITATARIAECQKDLGLIIFYTFLCRHCTSTILQYNVNSKWGLFKVEYIINTVLIYLTVWMFLPVWKLKLVWTVGAIFSSTWLYPRAKHYQRKRRSLI